MRKILCVLLVSSFCICATIDAQKNKKEDDYSSYNLDNSQSERLKAINKEYGDKFDAVKKNKSLSDKERDQKNRALAQQKRNKVREVLKEARSNKKGRKETPKRKYSYTYNEANMNKPRSRAEALKQIEEQIASSQGEYKIELANIKESSRDDAEYKRREKALKEEFKRRNSRLNEEKKNISKNYP